jgi:hypothetical protein
MPSLAPRVLVALTLVGVLTLSSCSVFDQLVGESPEAAQTETDQESVSGDADDTPDEATPDVVVVEAEDVVPDCASMYSAGLQSAFADDGREPIGDRSGSGYSWGSVNDDLVKILQEVRSDLRVSCTWVMPASESASTTTIAIFATELLPDIEAALREEEASPESLGDGQLWKLDQTSSSISGEFDANETHFLVTTTCPASLAEPECTLWVATTFSFGSSERLTRDAAEMLGKL